MKCNIASAAGYLFDVSILYVYVQFLNLMPNITFYFDALLVLGRVNLVSQVNYCRRKCIRSEDSFSRATTFSKTQLI